MRWKTMCGCALLGFGVSGQVWAQGGEPSMHPAGPKPGGGPMKHMMMPGVMMFDTNGDGKVSKEEWNARGREQFERMLKRLDTDGDTKISESEFLAQSTKGFEKMDENNDGFVTQEEWQARANRMQEKMHSKMKDMMEKMPTMPVPPSGKGAKD